MKTAFVVLSLLVASAFTGVAMAEEAAKADKPAAAAEMPVKKAKGKKGKKAKKAKAAAPAADKAPAAK